MTPRGWLRLSLGLFAVLQASAGLWQLIAPRSFYDDFPLPGHHWVAALPAYNEHLMRDVGSLDLAMAVVLGAAAISMKSHLVRVSLLASLVFALPHLAFHATHTEGLSTADAVAQTTVLSLAVAVQIALLLVACRTHGMAQRE